MNQEPSLYPTGHAGPPGRPPLLSKTAPSTGSELPTELSAPGPRRRGVAGWWVVLAAVVLAILVVLAITVHRSHQAPPIISAASATHGSDSGVIDSLR